MSIKKWVKILFCLIGCLALYISISASLGSPRIAVKKLRINGKKPWKVFDGIINIDGLDTIKSGDSIDFTIRIKGIKGKTWVEASLRNSEGIEQGLAAVQVEDGEIIHLSASISSALKVSSGVWDIGKNVDLVQYMISLWGKRIDTQNCKAGYNGKPCAYCQKNGYHMEERLKDTGWVGLGHYTP